MFLQEHRKGRDSPFMLVPEEKMYLPVDPCICAVMHPEHQCVFQRGHINVHKYEHYLKSANGDVLVAFTAVVSKLLLATDHLKTAGGLGESLNVFLSYCSNYNVLHDF